MNIPPLIRTGPVPPQSHDTRLSRYVVLTRDGWAIVYWATDGMLLDQDEGIRWLDRVIDPASVLCWTPQDGS